MYYREVINILSNGSSSNPIGAVISISQLEEMNRKVKMTPRRQRFCAAARATRHIEHMRQKNSVAYY